jgi:competence protein ComEC
MRLVIVSFFSGILLFQQLAQLPSLLWILLFAVIIPLYIFVPVSRIPLAIVSGFLWALIHAAATLSSGLPAQIEGKDIILKGIISAIPEQRPHGVRFQFDIQDLLPDVSASVAEDMVPMRVLLSWYGESPQLTVGDTWQLKVRLKQPHGFMNPGGFDYEGWLFQRQIRATGYVRKDPANHLLVADTTSMPLQRLRQRLVDDIHRQLPDNEYRGIITALAIGERQGISPHQWDVLTRTGTNHLVAISGLHIGLVTGLVYFLMRWLWSRSSRLTLRWPAPKAAAITGLAAALGYAALAGFSIPTQRALIMISIVMLGILTQRERSPTHTLLIALLAVMILDPVAVMSAGFWLSFLAVAIILFGMSGRGKYSGLWWKWGRLHLLIAIGLLPVMLVLFQRVPELSPLANLIAVPWISILVVPFVLAGVILLLLVPVAGGVLLMFSAISLSCIWPVLEWIATIDLVHWVHHVPVTWTLLPAIAGTILLISPRGIPGRWLGIIWLLPVFLIKPPRPADGELWITLLDVGQGLASVVQTHDHVLVYDTGPKFNDQFDTGMAVVVPYLHFQGLDKVNLLVIGHGDSDHIGGAASLAHEIRIDRAISSVPGKLPWINATLCNRDQQWRWDGVDFQVLNPPRDEQYKGNNSSCVLRISNDAGAVLLTGDIERQAERILLLQQADQLPSSILVAPHHGSRTSSTMEFIDAVRPKYVLFPVGYHNRFGFPKEDVIKRYQSIGAKLYNSAQHGAISFKLGADGTIAPPDTYRQSAKRYWHIDL